MDLESREEAPEDRESKKPQALADGDSPRSTAGSWESASSDEMASRDGASSAPGGDISRPSREAPINILSIVSLVCFFVFLPLAIVFGHVALSEIKRSGERGKGFATAALILSYGSILLVALIIILRTASG